MDLFEILLARKLGGGGGGITPSGTKDITANGNNIDVYSYAKVNVNVPNPSTGKVNITTTSEVNVTDYATAQVVDSDLIASNIKKDVNILGVVGTYEGGGSGGGGNVDDPVKFYDYDGTLLYSYTKTQFNNLSAMPRNPSHTGLTAQGWNWTLADAKTYLQSRERLNVGQIYVTSDGATRLYVMIDSLLYPDLTIQFGVKSGQTAIIDWGDNSATTTATTTSTTQYTHTYNSIGEYCISISGNITMSYSSGQNVFGAYANYVAYLPSRLRKVEIGSNLTQIGTYAFYRCNMLKSITIPNNITSFGQNALYSCTMLNHVNIPSGITETAIFSACDLRTLSLPKSVNKFGTSFLPNNKSIRELILPIDASSSNTTFNGIQHLESLTYVELPSNITTLDTNSLQALNCLPKIVIPSTVTKINSGAMSSFYSCKEMHFLSTTPPTLTANALGNPTTGLPWTSNLCTIYVPSASLNTYKTADNWSAYASFMVGE